MTVETLTSRHWPEQVSKEWRELQEDATTASIFQTWEWNSTWWEHFGANKRPYVVRLDCDGRLVAYAALYEAPGAWNALRFVGNFHADYLGMTVRTGFEREAARTLIRHLVRHETAHLLDLHQLPDTSALLRVAERMPHSWRRLQAVCSRLTLPQTWEEYWGSLSRNMRSSYRRYEQAADRDLSAELAIATPGTVDAEISSLFSLHGRRWRRRGQPGAMFSAQVQRFHRAFSKTAAELGWLRLHVLRDAGTTRAALYAFAFGNATSFYQSGFDPQIGKISPGSLTLGHAIRTAIAEGQQYFDFLRGQEAYKSRWKPQTVVRNYRVIVPLRGVQAQLGVLWNRLGNRVEHLVREKLEGGLGDHHDPLDSRSDRPNERT